jgi:hypothetical protein
VVELEALLVSLEINFKEYQYQIGLLQHYDFDYIAAQAKLNNTSDQIRRITRALGELKRGAPKTTETDD